MKGVTFIETLVFGAIVTMTLFIAYTVITGEPQTPESEQEQCTWYQNYPQKDLPAKCLKYYK